MYKATARFQASLARRADRKRKIEKARADDEGNAPKARETKRYGSRSEELAALIAEQKLDMRS